MSPITYGLIIAAALILVPLAIRPKIVAQSFGRLFAFSAIVVLPVVTGFAGISEHMENSKTVEFCVSCHVMDRHGQSLHIDDALHLPATHYQYGRVPHDTACFSCHTDYTMYGDYSAKLRGLHHLWVNYIGTPPAKLHLYSPYNNRECLHCHESSRSFLEGVTHQSEPGRMDAIKSNRLSCLSKACHSAVHDADELGPLPMWPTREPAKKVQPQ